MAQWLSTCASMRIRIQTPRTHEMAHVEWRLKGGDKRSPHPTQSKPTSEISCTGELWSLLGNSALLNEVKGKLKMIPDTNLS